MGLTLLWPGGLPCDSLTVSHLSLSMETLVATAEGQHADRFRRRRKTKSLKARDGTLDFVVGRDIYLDRIHALCSRALIGRLEYASMDNKKMA